MKGLTPSFYAILSLCLNIASTTITLITFNKHGILAYNKVIHFYQKKFIDNETTKTYNINTNKKFNHLLTFFSFSIFLFNCYTTYVF